MVAGAGRIEASTLSLRDEGGAVEVEEEVVVSSPATSCSRALGRSDLAASTLGSYRL